MAARKFLFDRDFRAPAVAHVYDATAIAAAEERGYARGLADGQSLVRNETATQLALTVERLAQQLATLVAERDAVAAAAEDAAVAFAVLLARKIAGAALDTQPLAAVEDAARDCLRHLRGVPHVVVRVGLSFVDAVDEMMGRLARERGFEGRIVVLGDPDMMPSDVRIEWADGGLVRDRAALQAAVTNVVALTLGPDVADIGAGE
ncbi:FliH/SctL family protein [Chelatococcus sp. SYSU_G07232]|uniref:FliH/SctL family protein n=1 Tax=Chelatococcus albus TaxID=3047466 RepID=A0ABT7AGI4_9HYPH|nr:FliH/SctL family protein [Chelatococcus sp. SYSU_G07232]MDJ1158122.1 FliH/SctL family protein [Chelatococcus sp. SYSU_G07232]